MEHDNTFFNHPSRNDVSSVLQKLINGDICRDEAALWASKWILNDAVQVDDKKVWQALDRLSGADMISTDRPYLYNQEDFKCWLSDVLAD